MQFNFNIDTSRQIQFHQCINCLVCRIDDVHQALVCSDFELVTGRFVNVWGTQNIETLNTGWQWNRAFDNSTGTFGCIDDFLWQGKRASNPRPSVLETDALPIELFPYFKSLMLNINQMPPRKRGNKNYSVILATTPAPTVLPPSRMANLRPSSMAIGLINLTLMLTLSPGMTISLSFGSSMAPVTSVVRK